MKKTSTFKVLLWCAGILFLINLFTSSDVVIEDQVEVCYNVGPAKVCKTLKSQETYSNNIFRKALAPLKPQPKQQPQVQQVQTQSSPVVQEKTLGEILMSRCGGYKVNCQSI